MLKLGIKFTPSVSTLPNVFKKSFENCCYFQVMEGNRLYIVAIQLLDQKLLDMEIKKNDELPNGTTMGFLRHLVTNTNLTMEEIYVSTTELLLAGVDTVSVKLGSNLR